MMKSIFFGVVAIAVAFLSFYQETAQAQEQTGSAPAEYKWDAMDDQCRQALHGQINKEFDASIIYLKYAAFFAQEKINLPGFEKFFFHAAGEEREHGIKLIEYALMRGHEPVDKLKFNLDYSYRVPSSTDGEAALRAALQQEEKVTQSIREVIKACETGTNDYHLVDYLTGEYLDEQHKGQRELAEKIETLRKMKKTAPKLGEFLFDKSHM
ncbi:ferritin subunit-like [Toxorhynchites rutilus septentrionalis]|uniref:ferritin subunit-like n=1 Tax=Toxorhynchites rutilus septentrionalis TaxID=329112 RepID=UPI0024783DFB|nr:ferritin subunit-like [Toxorhynchites rutilus septentrionalis]XP_055616472.1 ferritin subunit-like [Toxorhynchites rutilus septentrionalis]